MRRSLRGYVAAAPVLTLLGLLLAPVAGPPAAAAPQAPVDAPPQTSASDGAVVVDESGIAPEDRDEVLGDEWRGDVDEAHVVLNDADGLTVLTARASAGYAWEQVASVPVPWADTDLWVANSCVTSSGDRMAVVYAPRAATNDEAAFSAGARAAIVDLRSGAVTELGTGYTIAYYNPGCGADDTVTITRLEPEEPLTRVAVVDARTAEVTTTVDLEGQVTSAVARADGTVLAARGADVIAVAPGAGAPEVVVAGAGTAYDLTLDGSGRLAYVTRDGDGAQTATAYVTTLEEPAAQAIGTGPVTQTGVEPAADGGFYLTGAEVEPSDADVPGVELLPEASPDSVISSTGELVVDAVSPAGLADVPDAGAPGTTAVVPSAVAEIAATAVETGARLHFEMGAAVRPTTSLAVERSPSLQPFSTSSSASTTATTTGDPTNPVEAERWCAVPRNDVKNQAYQPKPRQVEWAVNRAVKGQLNDTRPANWRNLGMAAYSPHQMFPPRTLIGGGTIPPQIVLGILMQESNLWQASRYTAPGNTGNPLIGDYYGVRDTGSIWKIEYSGADCGYGIGQITDGMRLPGFEREDDEGRKIERALPYDQQRAIAVDYAANIAKAVQMLGDKWNELARAGMLVNGGDPKYIENWFMATWAYNSGFHPYVDANTPWGVGWFNNPANPNYSQTRPGFLSDQSHAAHPQDWPYPEKVTGWAAYGTSLVETQSANPTTREYDSRRVSSYLTAWWNSEMYRARAHPPLELFCEPHVNDCDPGDMQQPCQLSTSTTHYFECWWHEPVEWKPDCKVSCGQGFERFPYASHPTEASSMLPSLPAKTLESSFLPNCTAVPAGTVVVDDTTHPSARNSGECSRWSTVGSFAFRFGAPDAAGRHPSKVDLHQQGGGFNAHFYFAHMQHRDKKQTHVTGTWDRGADMTGTWTRVWVHLPDYAAFTQQAGYTIDLGDGTTQTRYLPQRRYKNEWVSLGVFEMKGSPKVSLSNVLVDESARRPIGHDGKMEDIDGYDNVAWDAVGFQALPGKPDEFVVALGDSYASGEGAGDYAAWSDNNGRVTKARNNCHQSRNAWIRKTTIPGDTTTVGRRADTADVGMDFHFLACSGAESEHLLPYYSVGVDKPHNGHRSPTTGEYDEDGRYGQHGTVSQLDAGYLDTNTTLVTLSIGGNDMRFGPIVAGCVVLLNPSSDCSGMVLEGDNVPVLEASAARLETELPESLSTVLRIIRERAPNARIAVAGYPKLFETETRCVQISPLNKDWLNDLADRLNAKIEAVVDAADHPAAPAVVYVDTQAKFTGRNLCTPESGINGLQFEVTPGEDPMFPWLDLVVADKGASQTSVHPNDVGTGLYARALEDALASRP